jgi:hypothetical protein
MIWNEGMVINDDAKIPFRRLKSTHVAHTAHTTTHTATDSRLVLLWGITPHS